MPISDEQIRLAIDELPWELRSNIWLHTPEPWLGTAPGYKPESPAGPKRLMTVLIGHYVWQVDLRDGIGRGLQDKRELYCEIQSALTDVQDRVQSDVNEVTTKIVELGPIG